ncbi:MAG: metalloprotease family protein [Bacteroidota bacterium]
MPPFIPGQFIALITFPGVMIHELAHELFCYLTGVKVYEVCYFQFDKDETGYVLHEATESVIKNFLISMAPLLLGTFLPLLIFSFGFLLFEKESVFLYPFFWLGGSIGMHAFPSNGDASILNKAVKEKLKNDNYLVVICYPFLVLVWLANLLSFFWADLAYSALLGIASEWFINSYLFG